MRGWTLGRMGRRTTTTTSPWKRPRSRPSSYPRPRLPRGGGRPRLALRLGERQGGVDEPHVRERLGEVAEEGAARGVDLLGVEPDVVGEGHEMVEAPGGRLELPHPRQH